MKTWKPCLQARNPRHQQTRNSRLAVPTTRGHNPCTVPTDRELYAATLSSKSASKPETAFVAPTWGATLAFVGLAFLEMLGLK